MHNPKFSIITITFNAEHTLRRTLRSIAGQSYTNIEYILIDGASTDGTLAVAEEFRPHINVLVSEPDNGLYDAMNKGFKAATGDYVCFMNAGDRFHNEHILENIVEALQEEDISPDIIYGDTAIVNDEGIFLHMRHLSPPEQLDWRSFRRGMLVCHQSFITRRALAEPYDLQYRFSADFDWCIRMMKKAKTLRNSHLIITDYLEEGLTTQNHKASLKERFHIMCRYYGTFSTVLRHAGFIFRSLK